MSVNNQAGQSDLSTSILQSQSDKDTDFELALATNAMQFEPNLFTLPSNSILIWAVHIMSVQNLDWRVVFFSTAGGQNVDLDLDSYAGAVRFDAVQAFTIAGAITTFYYDAHGTGVAIAAPDFLTYPYPLPYRSTDGFMHIGLQNAEPGGGTAKIAGAGGFVSLRIQFSIAGA